MQHVDLSHVVCVVLGGAAVVAGCVRIVAPEPTAPATEPRLSWQIQSGPQGGAGASEICRSDLPRRCVLQASTSEEPRVASVSIFLHPASAPTTYTGAVRVGFIGERPDGYELTLEGYTIDPDAAPVGITAAGPVTAAPGTYEVDIAFTAQRRWGAAPRSISRSVVVRVGSPE